MYIVSLPQTHAAVSLRSQQMQRFSPAWQSDLLRTHPVSRISNVDNPVRSFHPYRSFTERHFTSTSVAAGSAPPTSISVNDYSSPCPFDYSNTPRKIAPRPPPMPVRRPAYFNFPKLERSPTDSGELEPGSILEEPKPGLSVAPIPRPTVAPWSAPQPSYYGSIFTPLLLTPSLPLPPPLPPPPQVVNRSLDSIPLRTRASSHQYQSYHQDLCVETSKPSYFIPFHPGPHPPYSYQLHLSHHHYHLS